MSSFESSEIRKDEIFDKWVIFSPARSKRPSDFKSKSPATTCPNSNNESPSCPFCIGRENECAPEIFRFPSGSSNWKIRVIENLYPALRRVSDFKVPKHNCTSGFESENIVLDGLGFHDVVIETPAHPVRLWDLCSKEVGDVLIAYKKRIEQINSIDSLQYVQIFKNHGASAGASMSHSHSQIMALPIIPPTVSTRLKNMKDYFDRTRKCLVCEFWSRDRLIADSQHFFSMVPFAASFPFETWIVPKDHSPHFHELSDDKAVDLGALLKLMLQKLSQQMNDPPFNYVIHTSPLHLDPSQLSYNHWFIQIVPQLSATAGFELGSGCFINPVFPEDAAKVLRGVNIPLET